MQKIIVLVLSLFILGSCTSSDWQNTTTEINKIKKDTLDNLVSEWKKTYIWVVGTFCTHCDEEMPILDRFYKQNKDKVDMKVIVIDNKKFAEDYEIPQIINTNIWYQEITWEECWYIPSYVIFDEFGNMTDKKCGWALAESELKNILLTNNNNMSNNIWLTEEEKKSKVVEQGDQVSVHYTGTLSDWTQFDSSLDRWIPLEFMAGAGNMISWFDKWVMGMKIWEKKIITIPPEEAYWEYIENNIQEIPNSELEQLKEMWISLNIWDKLPTIYGYFDIIEVNDNGIVIDNNHELAGETLTFDIEIINIQTPVE